MRRRRVVEEEHVNHERWLVSYADFITLLFAFFVVMYAISQVNEGKYRVLSNSLEHAFRNVEKTGGGPFNAADTIKNPVAVLPPKAATPKAVDEEKKKVKNVARDISDVLAPLVSQGKVRILQTSRGVTIEINDSILFSPGQAILQSASDKAMRAVAAVLVPTDFPITIEGHTDNVPINTPLFPSNWELSAVRATTVLRLFVDVGVRPEQLTAIGYGETRPVSPDANASPEGRARNRRVSILIDSSAPEKPVELPENEPVPLVNGGNGEGAVNQANPASGAPLPAGAASPAGAAVSRAPT